MKSNQKTTKLPRLINGLSYSLFCLLLAAHANAIKIVTPDQNETVNAQSVIVLGESDPQKKLYINEKQTRVYQNGSFVTTVALRPGKNYIRFHAGEETIERIVMRPVPATCLPASPLRIATENITPAQDIEYLPGDTIKLEFKGAPGHTASARIGSRIIPMQEATSYKSITKPPFCESQLLPSETSKGLYQGTYIIQPGDNFQKTQIVLNLASENEEIKETLPAKVTVLPANIPLIAQINTANAVIRIAPESNRLTPLPLGVKLHITAKVGANYRFTALNNQPAWIEEKYANLLPGGTPLPRSEIYQVFIEQNQTELTIKIPLKEKLPFNVEQVDLNHLKLQITGAFINVDFIKYPTGNKTLNIISWQQDSDGCEFNINPFFSQLYGYTINYEGTTLVLKLKIPPHNNLKKTLSGKLITIDPGHGGPANGAIGPTGVKEKTVNLAIAKYLKSELEKFGVKVLLTRTTEEENPSFEQRIQTATGAGADVLLSIHNNALPNGRDPYAEHGSSTYYYHQQSLPLARAIQATMLTELGLIDYGVYWGNLVMARPSSPVAVLVEVGFMIHPEEYEKLIDPKFQQKAAVAIRKGLEKYFSGF